MPSAQVETPPQEKRKPGRPKKEAQSPPTRGTFWKTCGEIPDEEWGARASIWVYRHEPIIDRARRGKPKYIEVYEEPVSEDRLMRDHGSGTYGLVLNFRKAGEKTGNMVDSTEVSIMNSKFPPKIQPGDWVDDPRNKEWEWVKATFPKPAGETSGTLLEAVKVVNDIQATARNGREHEEPPNRVSEMIDTIKAVRELTPAPPAPQTENETLKSIVAMMIASGDRAQKQNDNLMNLLVAQMNRPPSPQPTANTSFTDAINVISDKLLPLVEKLKPSAEEAFSNFTRKSKMTGWMEMLQPAIPAFMEFLKPVGMAVAQRMMQPQNNGAQSYTSMSTHPVEITGNLPPGNTGSGTPVNPNPSVSGFPPVLNMIAVPLLNWMRMEADPRELGRDFAEWVHEGLSADPRFAQALSLAKVAGANSVLVAFKGSPYWLDKGLQHDQPSLADMEPKFTVFIESFLRWQPSDETEEDPETIDITGGEIQ